MKLYSELDANNNYLRNAKLKGKGGNLLMIDADNNIVASDVEAIEALPLIEADLVYDAKVTSNGDIETELISFAINGSHDYNLAKIKINQTIGLFANGNDEEPTAEITSISYGLYSKTNAIVNEQTIDAEYIDFQSNLADTILELRIVGHNNSYELFSTYELLQRKLKAGDGVTITREVSSKGVFDIISATGSSADYSAQMAWVNAQMAGQLQEAANNLFSVATTAIGDSYWADEANSTTLDVTVTVKFDGANVQPDNHNAIIAAGWASSATGVYTKSVTGASGSVAAQAFNYTPQSGTYQGVAVTKNSTAKSITVKYPAYYGFSDSEIDVAGSFENPLTRITAKLTQTADLNNGTGSAAHLYILTHSTATATQSGNNILQTPQNVTLHGTTYKLYKSTNSAAAGGKFGDVALTINI